MSTLSLGDTVEGIGVGTGTRYRGKLVGFPRPGRKAHRILVKWVSQDVVGSIRPGACASIINVRKVEEEVTYVKNLIGPKPEPVEAPTFVAPFKSDGANVVDANGKVVTRVQFGGYTEGTYRLELPIAHKYELARVIAEALTEKFARRVEDSKSPF